METLEPPVTDTDTEQPTDEPAPRQRRAGGRRSRRQAGRRRAQRAARRAKRLQRLASVIAAIGVGVALVVIGSVVLDRDPTDDPPAAEDGPSPVAAVVDGSAALLVRTSPWTPGGDSTGTRAVGLSLLANDADAGASVIFLPSDLLVEIPGVGLDRLGLAQQYGGTDLTVATVENALGIELAGGLAIDDRQLGRMLDRMGGATVDVEAQLVERSDDGTGVLAFETGEQHLPGPRLAQLWSFQQRGETELDTYSRQQAVLEAVLPLLADDGVREEVLADDLGGFDTDLEPAAVSTLLGGLGNAMADGRLTFHLLPVTPLGTADDQLATSYQMRSGDVDDLILQQLPGAIPEGGGAEAVPIQVLNGVGVPGVGQQVDAALEGLGFRIVLSDNAPDFDHDVTQIVIYDETAAMVAAAEQVRAAMGVGTILVSRQPQSVVDLTIVVGADFTGGDDRVPSGL
ncbi:LCP family protein [Euzebya rosea]|uniref:LCP family protein n=1 Tax=Euzebya rosea TaxID=2052804 RepID=UPI000D3E908C|nr:LCP family protein [Euzebya rosea]